MLILRKVASTMKISTPMLQLHIFHCYRSLTFTFSIQILGIIPKESDGEHFEDALARVCRCVGGGNAADTADSDSDLEVVSDTFSINLRCPVRLLCWVILVVLEVLLEVLLMNSDFFCVYTWEICR